MDCTWYSGATPNFRAQSSNMVLRAALLLTIERLCAAGKRWLSACRSSKGVNVSLDRRNVLHLVSTPAVDEIHDYSLERQALGRLLALHGPVAMCTIQPRFPWSCVSWVPVTPARFDYTHV